MARNYDSGSSSDEHGGRRRDSGRDFKIRDVRGRSKYNGVEDKKDARESERPGNWERRGGEIDSRVRERNRQGGEKNNDVIDEKDKQDVRETEMMDNRERRGSEIDSRVRERNGQDGEKNDDDIDEKDKQDVRERERPDDWERRGSKMNSRARERNVHGGEKNDDDIDEKDKKDVRERERPDNRERRRGDEIDSRVSNVKDKEKNGDAKDGEDSRDEGKRQRKKREGSDGRKHELEKWMEDDKGRKSPRRRINDERDKKRIDEEKGTRIQGTEEDDGSESSDGEKRRVTDKDMRRGNERRRGGRRGSPDNSDSESSGGNRRLLNSERNRRDRKGGERRDKEDRGRKDRHDRDEDMDQKERKIPESKGELRDGRGGEAAKAPSQREPISVNANPGGDVATLGRTGGVYIPPFKLARMMKEVEDKSSIEYQRLTWDALRKSINGLVNKVNATNIKNIIPELFGENLIRGRGLYCRSCMKSQMASPGFTDVFSALVAVLNTKFPEIGELLLRRIILQLKRAYKRNDKPQLLAAVKFIAHLVNQQVAHELVALELLTVLLEQPTDDSVEVAVDFVKECGSILQDLCPKGLHGIFERFRGILHEGEIDKRVQFLIEGLFAIRKAKFQGHPAVRPELDLVEPEDQLTHEVSLDDEIDPETSLDIFKQDLNFLENERRYEEVKKSILGEESEDDNASDAGSDDEEDDEDDEDDDDEDEEQMQIKDATETNLINLRRTIYLTIMSSVDFEEAGHKLLKIKLEPGQEMELNIMLLECCSQERTYLRYYGLLGQRFCMVNKVYQENFETCFVQQYSMIHRLETNKLRNVAKFFAHLLGTDALPWHVLAYIRLTEEDTTSSSRIFIKILFQELSEHLGIRLLNDRLNDPAMHDSFESIFPKDNPRNTRFSINFFTSIGLGGITENLREYLKNMPRMIMQQQKPESEEEDGSSSSDSGSSSSESESSSSEDSDSSSDKHRKRRKNDRDDDKQKKRRKRN